MTRKASATLALVAGTTITGLGITPSARAAAPHLVTEHFNFNTDATWTGLSNRTNGQNYGFTNTDNTGTSPNPGSPTNVGGPATGAGEIGGTLAAAPFGANGGTNFYAFNIGGIDLGTTDLEAHGVLRYVSSSSNAPGPVIGFFKDASTYWEVDPTHHNDGLKGFVGIQLLDGKIPRAAIYDIGDNGNLDPGAQLAQLSGGVTVPFSIFYQKPTTGVGNEKGSLSVTINGVTSSCINTGTAFNGVNLFNYFGVMSGGRNNNSGSTVMYLDDLSFTSINDLAPPGWANAGSGDWNDPGNWGGNQVPNAVDANAIFGAAITSGATVFSNTNVTVGTITFNNANTYLLAGLGTLTLQVSSGNALVDVQQGSHKINLPTVVASNTTLNVASGTTLRVSDPVTINSGVSVTQTGAGTVLYESTINVLGGGSIAIGNSNHVAALTVANTATASLTPGNNKTLRADSLSLSGRLDIQDNRLITPQAVGSATGGVYSGVSGLIQSGRNGNAAPLWDGNGIVTSQANATGSSFTSIGVATGSQVKGIAGNATAVWNGQTVTGSDTLVAYTYGGDANLDGKINVDDYGHIDSSIPIGIAGWFNGDFNYDGKINVDDYGIIDFNIGIQGAPLGGTEGSSAGLTAVPEPASLGLVAAGAASMLLRRRRQPR